MRANAKINFFLRICSVLPGGYHELFMLMQEIDLADEIEVYIEDDGRGLINILSQADCPPEKDLCFRAARTFFDLLISIGYEKSRLPSVRISETKRIPAKAGLGGGSSDAASVLRQLQEHFRIEKNIIIPDERLAELAAGLGADVPFFLTGGSCICEGIGERIHPVPGLGGVPLILLKPEEGVPTGQCFALSDAHPGDYDEAYHEELMEIFSDAESDAMSKIRRASKIMKNDLQAPAVSLVPRIQELLDNLARTSPVYHAMSGSGSCVYAVYEDAEYRDRTAARLRSDLPDDVAVICANTVGEVNS